MLPTIDESKDVALGKCLVLGCDAPMNPAPCCFCKTHHPQCEKEAAHPCDCHDCNT